MIRGPFSRVNGLGAESGRPRIERRVYKVAGPNSLWHHDGYHSTLSSLVMIALLYGPSELIRWKIITHCFVDRYSRMIVGIQSVDNNPPDTILQLFQNAVRRFGWPTRVRGDYGIVNVGVARDQEREMSFGRGSYIFG
jgi:hypothetical protein